MAKRSHQIASRQAAISRERKKKKKSQSSEKRAESAGTPSPVEISSASTAASSSVVQSTAYSMTAKSSQSVQMDENRYQNVVRDIRKIAIIATPLVVILIILAFVL